MMKSGFDAEALTEQFAQATAKQGDALRKAVSDATLKALQGRELTLDNVRKVLKKVTEAASAGAAKNVLPGVDAEALLGKATAGIDAALLQAVQAHRKALQQFVDQGVGLKDERLQSAMVNIEKMEDVFFKAVGSAAKGMDGALQGPWQQVLAGLKLNGSETGAMASASLEQLAGRAQAALQDGRSAGLRGMQTLMDGYAAMVSGVLIGMSDALAPSATTAGATSATPAAGPTTSPEPAASKRRKQV